MPKFKSVSKKPSEAECPDIPFGLVEFLLTKIAAPKFDLNKPATTESTAHQVIFNAGQSRIIDLLRSYREQQHESLRRSTSVAPTTAVPRTDPS